MKFAAVGMVLLTTEILSAATTGTEYETLADKVKFFCPHALIHKPSDVFAAWLAPSSSPGLDKDFFRLVEHSRFDELAGLLKHSDPRVRTLALAGLFRSEDPHALPLIAGLARDREPTFMRPPDLPQYMSPGSQLLPQEQTVGMVAWTLVDFYLKAASPRYQVASTDRRLDFAEYWRERKDRKICASWYAARLAMATSGGDLPDAVRIERLRNEIAALPGDEAPIMLLWLRGFQRERHVVDQDSQVDLRMVVSATELVGQLKRIEREKLWEILKGQKFTDDPDINLGDGDTIRERMRQFLFDHALQLFSEADLPEMLSLARGEAVCQAGWWTAAARLQPEHAAAILHEGLEVLRKRNAEDAKAASLIACLWELEGANEARFIADWFYLRDSSGRLPRETVWERLMHDDRAASTRKLLRMVLLDERAAGLANPTLADMGSLVNRWVGRPVLTQGEIRTLSGGGSKGGRYVGPADVPGALDRLRKCVAGWDE